MIRTWIPVCTHGDDNIRQTNQQQETSNESTKQLMKEILLPIIEHEVNHGKYFANLRQIYNAQLLSVWFKKRMKSHVLGQAYARQGDIDSLGVVEQSQIQNIWSKYVKTFQDGVFDMIRDEYDPVTQSVIPKRYFSGGAVELNDIQNDEASLGAIEKVAQRIKWSLSDSAALSLEAKKAILVEKIMDQKFTINEIPHNKYGKAYNLRKETYRNKIKKYTIDSLINVYKAILRNQILKMMLNDIDSEKEFLLQEVLQNKDNIFKSFIEKNIELKKITADISTFDRFFFVIASKYFFDDKNLYKKYSKKFIIPVFTVDEIKVFFKEKKVKKNFFKQRTNKANLTNKQELEGLTFGEINVGDTLYLPGRDEVFIVKEKNIYNSKIKIYPKYPIIKQNKSKKTILADEENLFYLSVKFTDKTKVFRWPSSNAKKYIYKDENRIEDMIVGLIAQSMYYYTLNSTVKKSAYRNKLKKSFEEFQSIKKSKFQNESLYQFLLNIKSTNLYFIEEQEKKERYKYFFEFLFYIYVETGEDVFQTASKKMLTSYLNKADFSPDFVDRNKDKSGRNRYVAQEFSYRLLMAEMFQKGLGFILKDNHLDQYLKLKDQRNLSLGQYEKNKGNPLSGKILDIKDSADNQYKKEQAISLLNEYFTKNFKNYLMEQSFDFVMPIPSSSSGLSEMLADKIGEKINVPVKKSIKNKASQKQKELDFIGRYLNIMFYYITQTHKKDIEGKSVLVVDDVRTTGASLSAAVSSLYMLGAKSVQTIVLASSQASVLFSEKDFAQLDQDVGGIDLNSDQTDIRVFESENGFILPDIDPAILENFQVNPSIIGIYPTTPQAVMFKLGLLDEDNGSDEFPVNADAKDHPADLYVRHEPVDHFSTRRL